MTAGRERAHPAPPPAAPPLRLRHPAWITAGLVAALCVLLSVSFQLYEKDFWQHLLVGKAIWQLHRVPQTQVWSWPTYGTPALTPSWAFRALIWPIWSAAGVWGLFEWRWMTTLAAFGLAWAAARRMGAHGFTPLVVLVVCSLTYRQRSQIRPETLAAPLLALELWLLVARRSAAARARRWIELALAGTLAAWSNAHISYPIGWAILGVFVLDEHLAGRSGRHEVEPARSHPGARGLWQAAGLALLLSFLDPAGWRALWEPFDYVLQQAREPIFSNVLELAPVDLGHNLRNLLPVVLFGWPALALWRWWRGRPDRVELMLCAACVGLPFSSQRFLGPAILIAAPWLARDLDEWVRARRWPAWTARAWSRAALAALACVTAGLAEWRRFDLPLGVEIEWKQYPVRACDFMQAHGVRGRGFNPFYLGGYMLYRFWPERERLPFMDIHQSGTRQERYTYAFAFRDLRAWRDLDARRQFDYALLRRIPYPGDRLLDMLDADSTWALVYLDDAAALYVRRRGPLAAVADSFAYRLLPAGTEKLATIGDAATQDSALRAGLLTELEREVAGSPWHALAMTRIGSIALATGDLAGARTAFETALASDPRAPRAHERLGIVALREGRPKEALRQFALERRLVGGMAAYDLRCGQAWQALGRLAKARAGYARELKRDPGNLEAADSLRVMEAHLQRLRRGPG